MLTLLKNRYRILRSLNSGGFGETFLAEDVDLPSARRCVIKKLIPIASDPQIYQLVKQRFGREAVILEKLGEGNPHIPSLYAYFEEAGQFYLVQEWIEGTTLAEKVERDGVLIESFVREILTSILSVLDTVHAQHIVHRDIKPENIILRSSDNQPVLIDFGAVKETMGTVVTTSGRNSNSIVIGTPGFMPSEQSIGRPVYASDLYSLGLTAIYLLTNKYPQEFNTDPSTGEILWRQDAASTSPELAAILDKAIQSHPRDRFSTAKEMLETLQVVTPIGTNFLPTSPKTSLQKTAVISSKPTEVEKPVTLVRSSVNSPGLPDWIKALITGSLVGCFMMGALVLNTHLNRSSELQASTPQEEELSHSESKKNSIDEERPSAVDFTISHYQKINDRNYEFTWNHLSERFKKISKSYIDYQNWWNKVDEIKIGEVKLIEQNQKTAIVDIPLTYIMSNGDFITDKKTRLSLVWSHELSSWLIYSKKSPPNSSSNSFQKDIASLSWKYSCGSSYVKSTIWYRVLGSPKTLEVVKDNYCGDAIIVKSGNLQVASFLDENEAQEFANTLSNLTNDSFWVERFVKENE
jgi:serine/threonine protein kinase, bacterial